ncbi:MAG TPA: tRNA (adenosine(37)-N6)-threonylcarbamoyltransferase complex dimerization subunit type 1 TsaB [Candidatus Hydrogenedentes bacterium]|nr:tRNA (adenosine(37)-N6)-threonylcarbamoyltransferase complex dimerization subunit type 1 TsaB [Candidatus Hydrogenedentota bacterium]
MKILALDATTAILTVCVWDDGAVMAETVVNCGRTHTERLMDTVDWVLREAGADVGGLDMLAVAKGPGSFTGLRVGVAAMKGLALGAGLPLVGVPTLDALSRLPGRRDGTLCPVLDAKMSEVFGAVYRFRDGKRTRLSGDRVCPVESLIEGLEGPVLFFGDGAALYADRIRAVLPEAVFLPSAATVSRAWAVAEEASVLLAAGAGSNPDDVTPVYLRMSQAEEHRDRGMREGAPA